MVKFIVFQLFFLYIGISHVIANNSFYFFENSLEEELSTDVGIKLSNLYHNELTTAFESSDLIRKVENIKLTALSTTRNVDEFNNASPTPHQNSAFAAFNIKKNYLTDTGKSKKSNHFVSTFQNQSCSTFSPSYSPFFFCSGVVDYSYYLPNNQTDASLNEEVKH
jgi:hypothetical protein